MRLGTRSLAPASLLLFTLANLAVGCTNAESGLVPDSPSMADAAAAVTADVALGQRSVLSRGCVGCHDPGDGSLSGRSQPLPNTMAYPSNLTPDPDTGLGGWSDDDFARAIRTGLDDQMAPLCPVMPRFSDIDDVEMSGLVAYLRSLSPIHRLVPQSLCSATDDASSSDAEEPFDGGAAPADLASSSTDDLAAPITNDLALADPSDDLAAAPSDDSSVATNDADGGSACAALINEVQTAGPGGASDEYVELYNPCPLALALDDTRLVYRAGAGTTEVTLVHFPSHVVLAPRAFLVVANVKFTGHFDYSWVVGGLAGDGGGLGLRDPMDNLGDHLGWGDAVNLFVRGDAAPAPAASRSIARIPDGSDSGNDAHDFQVTTPTPGAANH